MKEPSSRASIDDLLSHSWIAATVEGIIASGSISQEDDVFIILKIKYHFFVGAIQVAKAYQSWKIW